MKRVNAYLAEVKHFFIYLNFGVYEIKYETFLLINVIICRKCKIFLI